ncbi:GRB2-associated-binding protein 3 isoform X1 [Mesoplodon densirostris]|uniref:GRB2-associated-binding protein 3 isoform X1 n=1 Tax=Mesoplodon densirostris TaxID=48708 RepID=UPI0028DC1C96|nr:GRB2-associated-binding protein 3 isoform X1 [Mesoplodon densirostris]
MSAGDAVCTGWLVKSPPERKLQRYAWRRRWFVLRRGRLSGDRDVLEYYRSQRARKPIRAIDLSECAVWKHAGPGFVRKEFQNHFVFVVKTASRTFYLVAKTEEEMQVWVHSISQVCNLGHLDDSADCVESGSRAPSCVQPSAASSLPRDDPSTSTVATEETGSESEFLFLPDYLILSNCETGRLHHASLPTRCDSWSNSERSLEQVSFDDVFVDGPQPLSSGNLACLSRPGNSSQEAPSTRPPAALIWTRDVNGPSRDHFSLPVLETSLNSTIQVDQNQASLPYGVKELDVMSNTPPPRPPKPSHLSERRHEDQLLCGGPSSIKKPEGTVVPRRISLSGLENMRTWKGDVEGQSLRHRDKRLSLNLPCRFFPMSLPGSASTEDSYMPMSPQATASALGPHCSPDDYIQMSSGSISSPLPELPADLEPPPVNRDLKPQRKSRSPPLDLKSLSTIREHTALTRTRTVPCNRTSFLSPERNGINSARFFANSVSREEEQSYMQMEEHGEANLLSSGALTWTRKFSLDYLALDFNSASPAPVQQKLLFSEEQRVDYVQVDEQKTQALQSTKQEWTDERQSKV